MIASAPTLVGRDAEIDALLGLLRRPSGGPSTVVVEGPEGVGKSALVGEVLRRHCGDATGGVVKAVGHRRDDERADAVFRQFGVDPAVGRSSADDGAPGPAIAEALTLVWGTPRVVVVEEAHVVPAWALEVVQSAVLATSTRPVLVLVARPEPRIDLPDSHRLRLTGLSPAAVADLVRSRQGIQGDATVRALWHLTAGLPGDLLDLIAETPADTWRERVPVFSATHRHRQRLSAVRDEVDGSSWRLLQAVAVLGCPAELGAAARLAGVGVEAADPLVTAGLLTAPTGRGQTHLSFSHPMTALAVRDGAGPGAVREMHRRAADLADDTGVRLRHLVRASVGPDPALAADLVTHAFACAEAGRWGEAARAYTDAAQVTGDDHRRGRHLVDAVDAYVGAGEIPPAVDLVPELESRPRTARTDAGLGYLSLLRGRSRDAHVYLTRAWAAVAGRGVGDGPDAPELRALVCARWVLHSLVSGDGQAVVEWADRSMEHGGPSSVSALEAAAIRGLGLGAQGRDAEAVASFDRAYTLVSSTAQTHRVTMGRAWLDLLVDDPLAARSGFESAASVDFSHGSARIALWAQAWLARTLFILGRWGESLDVARRAAAAIEASGHEIMRPLVHWPAAVIHAYRGESASAHAHLVRGSASEHEYATMWVSSAVAHAQVAESQADYASVLRALDPVASSAFADPRRDPGFWPWRDMYANALILTGRVTEAAVVLDTALAEAERRGRRSEIARTEIVRGRLFGAQGDLDAALRSFSRAEGELAGLPLPVESARLRFVQGQVLRRAGRRKEADDVLRAARDAFARLDASTYIARCDRELKASGTDRGARSGRTAELTPQETAVVDLVAAGATNKEVAGELYISVKTVQYHLTRVYAKLGLRSRSELAAHVAAAERGESVPPTDAPDPTPTEGHA